MGGSRGLVGGNRVSVMAASRVLAPALSPGRLPFGPHITQFKSVLFLQIKDTWVEVEARLPPKTSPPLHAHGQISVGQLLGRPVNRMHAELHAGTAQGEE